MSRESRIVNTYLAWLDLKVIKTVTGGTMAFIIDTLRPTYMGSGSSLPLYVPVTIMQIFESAVTAGSSLETKY